MNVRTPDEINERFRDAFNARDVGALLELYEPDAIVVPAPDAPPKRGLAEIEGTLRALVAVGGTLSFIRRHCLVNGDWALLSIDWILAGGSVDGNPVDVAAGSSEVVRRQPGGDWKYVIDHPFAVVESKTAAPPPATPRPQFMIRLFPHRGVGLLRNPTPEERTIMGAHRTYMEMLAGRGQLVLTGLSEETSDVDGMVIVEANSEKEARHVMDNDPFVLGGLARAELRPFRTVLIRG